MRGKHNIQYIWCELFPEDCLSLIVQLQPKYSDAGQPASSCYCSTVWASSLVEKEKEREREGETDFSLPFISVPCFPLCSLSEHPASFTARCSGACYAVQMSRSSCRMWHCHSSRGLTRGCIASLLGGSQMAALPDSLTVRHPVICVARMSNTLSSQQKYLGSEEFLGVGARLSCISTLNFAIRCKPG